MRSVLVTATNPPRMAVEVGGSATLILCDAGTRHGRTDVIAVTSTGHLIAVLGTESPDHVVPLLPAGAVPLAFVEVPQSVSFIYDSLITLAS